MDYENSMDQTQRNKEEIKDLFEALATDAQYDAWADTFEVVGIDKKRVTIAYSGRNIKGFKKACTNTLRNCVRSVLGEYRKIKIKRGKKKSKQVPDTKKNVRAAQFFIIGMVFVCIAAAIAIVLCNYLGNQDFKETFYSASSIKVDSRVRVIQLSDLHGARFGENNEKLLRRIKALEPDVIICTGDMVNSPTEEAADAAAFAGELAKIAPAYYIYGNNEVEYIYDVPLNEKELDAKFGFTEDSRDEAALKTVADPFEEKLEAAGIKVLKNEKDTIQIRTMQVDIYGVLNSNPSSFWSYSGQAFSDYIYEDRDHLKITAVHEPFIFETFQQDYWGDLLLCGHTHGGLVRVPVLGPLYTREGGLFPGRSGSYVYGRYDVSGSPLIVSAGFENNTLLRINNEPELVIIDINKF